MRRRYDELIDFNKATEIPPEYNGSEKKKKNYKYEDILKVAYKKKCKAK